VETAYLLQRLESYEGVVVLATNLAKNIDVAFLRRLHALIEFPVPEKPERRRIWEHNLMPGAPTKDVDLDFLANQFAVTGGSIRNAVLGAAFLAAEAGTAITMATLIPALQREFQKLGRLVTPTDFGPYAEAVTSGREAQGQTFGQANGNDPAEGKVRISQEVSNGELPRRAEPHARARLSPGRHSG
jgi:SpoVK/Ycf46/Vps4 family AAA+-type ATPase